MSLFTAKLSARGALGERQALWRTGAGALGDGETT
jgi:hypothetical protein